MRPLTEEETKTLFLKLSEYIGKNIEKMIHRSDERHCFRLMKDRCYYISESIMKAATSISRDNLLHAGTCIGKFTKSGKFRLHITALEYLSQYAKVRTKNEPNTRTNDGWISRHVCVKKNRGYEMTHPFHSLSVCCCGYTVRYYTPLYSSSTKYG